MSLSPGTRLGPYEVTAQIGAGGMGEVCRARDTRLNREVALKMLPAAFATAPDRMTRFQREAQLLAALNHPNIAAIYGLEEAGTVRAIVMELVEGHTLTGPMPVADALPIAKQIAEALDYAHDRGIIHRDLKPANVKVTRDGSVKVLDFGLAKAMDDTTDAAFTAHATMSPTLSLAATQAGLILGTAAYMAPEQAKGKPVDRRADVWAFGVVLYEMLTGTRMFGGDSVPETLASVMKDQIALKDLPADTPASIRRLLTRCLQRDPRRRLQSIGEARIAIEDAIAGVAEESDTTRPAPVTMPWSRWLWAAAGFIVALGAALAWTGTRPAPPPPAVTQFTIPPPEGTVFTVAGPNAPHVAVSPDGRYIAFIADQTGQERAVWVRALDSPTARRLDRTEGAAFPFWSPDSRHIAYFAGGKLMRVAVAGGAPITICDSPAGEGGAWTDSADGDGVIVFAPTSSSPLSRVLARGGTATPVTTLASGEQGHSFPHFLPDGQRFLYWVRGPKPGIYVQSLGSNERAFVVAAPGRGQYAPPFLLYMRDNTLLAHRWNLDTLALEGEPFTLAEEVRAGGANGRNAFSVSASGLLVYRGGNSVFQIASYTRQGKSGEVVVPLTDQGGFALSPNDGYLVVSQGLADNRDLWLKDLTTGVLGRLTSAPGFEHNPVWSPDSRRIAYGNSQRDTVRWYQTVMGSGKHTVISSNNPAALKDWTPDGRLVFRVGTGTVGMVAAPEEGGALSEKSQTTLLNESYYVDQVRVSPNGKWVAYTSFESTRPNIWVAAFPSFTDRRQISTSAAMQPAWRADGRELFFLAVDQKLMSIAVDPETLRTGRVEPLFQTQAPATTGVYMFAPTRDGQRFYVREPQGSDAIEQLNVVMNWPSLVR
jgi:Tol biopolymer transport system component